MNKAIEAANLISKDLNKNHSFYLEDIGLSKTFSGIYYLGLPGKDENRLICFIIYSYDPDSKRLDIRKDRYENKYSILESLGAHMDSEVFNEILTNSNEEFNNVVTNYLESLTNWRWPSIYSLLDYHSSMIRFATQKTEAEKSFDKINKEGVKTTLVQEYDIDTISKVNLQKSEIFKRAIEAREQADKLLEDIRKEFMPTDHAIQSDFGFTFTDTAKKKVDIMSWRSWIQELNEKKRLNGGQ